MVSPHVCWPPSPSRKESGTGEVCRGKRSGRRNGRGGKKKASGGRSNARIPRHDARSFGLYYYWILHHCFFVHLSCFASCVFVILQSEQSDATTATDERVSAVPRPGQSRERFDYPMRDAVSSRRCCHPQLIPSDPHSNARSLPLPAISFCLSDELLFAPAMTFTSCADVLLIVPPEVWLHILSFLDFPELENLAHASPVLACYAEDPVMQHHRLHVVAPSRVEHSLFGQSSDGYRSARQLVT
ncbi:hypothetical protein C8Q72DRAFT_492517 [Fomitopsis betulina]|nr:hypothetical protein C8Q72DRAFT_492517 [Fomitopsis betulina]